MENVGCNGTSTGGRRTAMGFDSNTLRRTTRFERIFDVDKADSRLGNIDLIKLGTLRVL
ncbi:unnamed protein product, partial [Rotaria magnacalcarata]